MVANSHYICPPHSWREIDERANQLRKTLGLLDQPYFPVIEILDKILPRLSLFFLEISSKEEMGADEGQTCIKGRYIRLRNDVYEAACKGEGRARFTAAHELGHWGLHSNVITMARLDSKEGVAPHRQPEPQANRFAASLLMPEHLIKPGDRPGELVERHGVSWSAAYFRLKNIKKRGPKGELGSS